MFAFGLLMIVSSLCFLVYSEFRKETVRVYDFADNASYYLDARGRARCKATNKFVKRGV